MLASLNHPHIAAIYGLEEFQGVPFLVLELVEGSTLAERIARGPMPPAETLAIAAQIVEALEYAHERNVIHRDLQPANIKLTPDGSVKVLDFGLAKALAHPAPASHPTDSPTSAGFGESCYKLTLPAAVSPKSDPSLMYRRIVAALSVAGLVHDRALRLVSVRQGRRQTKFTKALHAHA